MKARATAAFAVAGGFAVLSAGCSQSSAPGTVCTALYAYGLTVTAQDSVTGLPAMAGATAVASEGAYSDSAIVAANAPQNTFVGLAGERAGSYTVTVRKPAYQTWSRSGIEVTRDVCHVHGVSVTARLVPQ